MTTRCSAGNLQRLNEPALCDTEQRNINSSTNMQVVSGTEINSRVRLVQRAYGTEINSPNPNDGVDGNELNQRDYTFNMNKAIRKKIVACNAEYKMLTEHKGGNFVFVFSTAMYELYRTALVEDFELVKESDQANIKITYKDSCDRSGL